MIAKILPLDPNCHNIKLSFDEVDPVYQDYIHRVDAAVERALLELLAGDFSADQGKKRDRRVVNPTALNQIPGYGISNLVERQITPFHNHTHEYTR